MTLPLRRTRAVAATTARGRAPLVAVVSLVLGLALVAASPAAAGRVAPAAVSTSVPLTAQAALVRGPGDARVPAAVPADRRVRVVNHNIEKRARVLQRVLATVARTGAEVVTLQEVCWWQAVDLRLAHPAWTISFKPERRNDACRRAGHSGDTLGLKRQVGNIAIWTGGPGGATSTHTFGPQRNGSDGVGLACVAWVAVVRHRACSVHLIAPTAPDEVRVRTAQARDTRRITRPWLARGDLVVLGGDFNAEPGRQTMRHLYAHEGVGSFRESTGPSRSGADCRCGRGTYDGRRAKIDYIFFSANRTDRRGFRSLRVLRTRSDHHLLVGTASVDVAPR